MYRSHLIMTGAALAMAGAPALAGEGAHADAKPRLYVAGFIGTDSPDTVEISGANAGGAVRDIEAELDDGELRGVAFGVAGRDTSFGRLRGEVELSFREADLVGLALNDVAREIIDGSDVSTTAALINVAYDTPKFLGRVRLSAGAGFGIASIDHEIRYLVANAAAIGTIPGQLQIAIPSSETAAAYQLTGGASFELTPSLSVTADARYFDLGDVQAERYILNTIINGTATTTGTLDSILDSDYATSSLTIGLRYTF